MTDEARYKKLRQWSFQVCHSEFVMRILPIRSHKSPIILSLLLLFWVLFRDLLQFKSILVHQKNCLWSCDDSYFNDNILVLLLNGGPCACSKSSDAFSVNRTHLFPDFPSLIHRWYESGWRPCSRTCGKGIQLRQIVCRRKISQAHYETVEDSSCTEQKPIVNLQQECNKIACPAEWKHSAWSEVSDNYSSALRFFK